MEIPEIIERLKGFHNHLQSRYQNNWIPPAPIDFRESLLGVAATKLEEYMVQSQSLSNSDRLFSVSTYRSMDKSVHGRVVLVTAKNKEEAIKKVTEQVGKRLWSAEDITGTLMRDGVFIL